MRRATAILSILLIVPAFLAAVASAQNADYSHYVSPWKTPWDYAGPRGYEHWSELDPAYALCNTGKAQGNRRGQSESASYFRGSPFKHALDSSSV